jgi:hypothetical protein
VGKLVPPGQSIPSSLERNTAGTIPETEMKKIILLLVVALLSGPALTSTGAPPDEPFWTNERLKQYSQMQMRLNPKGEDLYKKVRELFGPTGPWTDVQVMAAQNQKRKVAKPSTPETVNQRGPMPLDAVPRKRAIEQLEVYGRSRLNPDEQGQIAKAPDKLLSYSGPDPAHPGQTLTIQVKSFPEALDYKYGRTQDWYAYSQLRDIETRGVTPSMVDREWPEGTPIFDALGAGSMRQKEWWEDFKSPRLRESWRDLLYEEDLSQTGNVANQAKDIVGASLSYTHNGKSDTDTWKASGALIFPWQHSFSNGGGPIPMQMALAPSVSVHRLDTNGDPKDEVDQLLFRLGAYLDWRFNAARPVGFQLRAAGVRASETGGGGRLKGYEVDVEPHWQNSYLPIGYKKVLIKKATIKEDQSDWSALDYTFRFWMHVEGGDVQNNGKSWDATEGNFLRYGPVLELQVNAPRLVFGHDLTLTGNYSHLHAIRGANGNETYLKATLAYTLLKDEALNHRILLKGEYEKGGLNFTKEDVDTFTFGLGITF